MSEIIIFVIYCCMSFFQNVNQLSTNIKSICTLLLNRKKLTIPDV